MNEIKLIKNGDSTYSCDVPISREDWSAILSDKKVTTDAAINTLLSFYFMPEQRSSCSDLEKIYGRKSGYYLGAINQFCRKVRKLIGTFTIADHDSNGEIYWPVAMACGRVEKGLFVWQLRKELTEALRDRVIDWYISLYSRIRTRLEKSDPLKISSNCRDMPVTKECSNALASTLPTRIRYL